MPKIETVDGDNFDLPGEFFTAFKSDSGRYFYILTPKKPKNLSAYIREVRLKTQQMFEEHDDFSLTDAMTLMCGLTSCYRTNVPKKRTRKRTKK